MKLKLEISGGASESREDISNQKRIYLLPAACSLLLTVECAVRKSAPTTCFETEIKAFDLDVRPIDLKNSLLGSVVSPGSSVHAWLDVPSNVGGQRYAKHFKVKSISQSNTHNDSTSSTQFFRITKSTQVVIIDDSSKSNVSREDTIFEEIALSVNHVEFGNALQQLLKEAFVDFGTLPHGVAQPKYSRSVLLRAPPRSGFTAMLRDIIRLKLPSCRINVVQIWSGQVFSSLDTQVPFIEPANYLHTFFQKAVACSPSILLLQDLEGLLSNSQHRNASRGHIMSAMKQFLAFLQSTEAPAVVVIGRLRGEPQAAAGVDPRLSEMFPSTFLIDKPTALVRRHAIRLVANHLVRTRKQDAAALGKGETNAQLVKEAIMSVSADEPADFFWDNIIDSIVNSGSGKSLKDVISHAAEILPHHVAGWLASKDGRTARSGQTNSADMAQVLQTHIGLESLVDELKECLLWPRLYHSVYAHFAGGHSGGSGTSGILLHGPPGTGKTLIVKHIRSLFNCRVLNVHISELVRGHVGAGEKALRQVFATAKQLAPCVIFFDEFQAVFSRRSDGLTGAGEAADAGQSLTSTLAGCFDDLVLWNAFAGSMHTITVVAATNEPWAIDKGFLRAGRFEKFILVGPPTAQHRKEYFQRRYPTWSARDTKALVCSTSHFTAADIVFLEERAHQDRDAKCQAEPEQTKAEPTIRNFARIMKSTTPTVSAEELREYRSWQRTVSRL